MITTNDEHHKLSTMDLIGYIEGSSISIDTDDGRNPKYTIDIHLECDKFSYGVDI